MTGQSSRKRSRSDSNIDKTANSRALSGKLDSKTPRSDHGMWWKATVAWIQGSTVLNETKGFVHAAIKISSERELCLDEPVEAGTLLFRIPPRCLVCWTNIARDTLFGKLVIVR